MAGALLRGSAAPSGMIEVESAGVWAEPGRPASDGSAAAMARMGIDLSWHRSRRVSPQLIEWSELVVTMESRHVVDLVARYPLAVDRIFTLREVVELVDTSIDSPGAGLVDRLPDLAAGRSVREHLHRTDLDVVDPIGHPRSHYRRCATELNELCEKLAAWLPPPIS